MVPSPANLAADLAACWRDYAGRGLPTTRRVAFCALRIGQRTAYWAGWLAGARPVRGLTP
ncbi:MAG: hypothetical protein ACK4YP_20840 [Myxococcota bacterium]